VLSLFTVATADEGIALARRLLEFHGAGHTAGIHTRNPALIERFGRAIPAGRILVNSPSVQGVVGSPADSSRRSRSGAARSAATRPPTTSATATCSTSSDSRISCRRPMPEGAAGRRHARLVLGATTLFGGLDPGTLDALVDALEVVRVHGGEELFAQGDVGDAAYLVLGAGSAWSARRAGAPV